MTVSVSVSVPATTANIGPGFDCLGAALSLYNQFDFAVGSSRSDNVQISVAGPGSEGVSTDPNNLVYQSFLSLYRHLNIAPPPISIHIRLNVPLSRGLGSSATAIIGGLMGANAIANTPLSPQQVLDLAIAIEGHPDNVAPALLGQCQLATRCLDGNTLCCPISWDDDLVPVVAIPDFELSTHKARSVLPSDCSYADSVFNASHLALLIKALESGQAEWLKAALNDQLHQPYRAALIKGYEAVQQAAIASGAYGLVISGAGPTLLALCPSNNQEDVVMAIKNTWTRFGVDAQVLSLKLDYHGTQITAHGLD